MRRNGGEPAAGGDEHVVTYCVVPREIADKAHESLRRHFAGDPSVEVIVERRRTERRCLERRAGEIETRSDRRRIRNLTGRRVAERRATGAPVEGPEALPRKVRHYSNRLTWVERIEPAAEQVADVDSAHLVIRFQAGDREAFGGLYLRYFDRVYSYLRVVFRDDPHQAEDLTQQVFTKVLEALPRYERHKRPFRAWLFTIVRNAALDQLERSGRSEATDPAKVANRIELASHPDADDIEALQWLTDRELVLFVERLPLAQQQVLVLRYMADLSSREIATILHRSVDDVRQLDFRARKFLERRLAAIGRAPSGQRQRDSWHRRRSRAPVLRTRRYALRSPQGIGAIPSRPTLN